MNKAIEIRVSEKHVQPQITDIGYILVFRENTGHVIELILDKLIPYALFEIVCVIDRNEIIDDIAYYEDRYSWIKFLLYEKGQVTTGDTINFAVNEISASHFFVLRSDMVFEKAPDPRVLQWMRHHKPVCAGPILKHDETVLPSIHIPKIDTGHVSVMPFSPGKDAAGTLFLFDYCGLYNRNAFLRLGGYASEFSTEYWQLMDFGTRCWLSGRTHLTCNGMALSYIADFPHLDISTGPDALLYHLRNCTFRMKDGKKAFKKNRFAAKGKILGPKWKDSIFELQHAAVRDMVQLVDEWEEPEVELI